MRLRQKPIRKTAGDYEASVLLGRSAHSRAAESYRMLRTGLVLQMEDDGKLGLIVVTSAGRGEGKSVTCANLASAFGQAGYRVAVVDADLRLPSQHLIFGVDAAGGLSEAVDLVEHDADGALRCGQAVGERLDLFADGEHVKDLPSEGLGSRHFASFLQFLKARYDVVLIDSAPIGLVADAALLSREADGVVFVVGYSQTNRRFLRRALSGLGPSRSKVVGAVLNRVPDKQGRQDGHYGGYYGGEKGFQ